MRIAVLAAAVLASACASSADGRWLDVEARAVPLDARDAARQRIGALLYRGGVELRADNPYFGGFSALRCQQRCFAVSDKGAVMRFDLVESAGRLTGIARAEVARIRDMRGATGPKRVRDAESLVLAPDGGWAEVGFERTNAIFAFRRGEDGEMQWTATGEARPEAMRRWPSNGGAETMLRLGDGRLLVIAEDAEAGGGAREALLFGARPADQGGLRETPARLSYRPPPGFKPTDAALLGDGRVLILNRAFSLMSGVAATLTVVPEAAIKDGAQLEGREIARLRPPLSIDNMEALEVRHEAGKTFVYLMSDDNFSPLERTLLLKFELAETPA